MWDSIQKQPRILLPIHKHISTSTIVFGLFHILLDVLNLLMNVRSVYFVYWMPFLLCSLHILYFFFFLLSHILFQSFVLYSDNNSSNSLTYDVIYVLWNKIKRKRKTLMRNCEKNRTEKRESFVYAWNLLFIYYYFFLFLLLKFKRKKKTKNDYLWSFWSICHGNRTRVLQTSDSCIVYSVHSIFSFFSPTNLSMLCALIFSIHSRFHSMRVFNLRISQVCQSSSAKH